jgi:hypothetical protein
MCTRLQGQEEENVAKLADKCRNLYNYTSNCSACYWIYIPNLWCTGRPREGGGTPRSTLPFLKPTCDPEKQVVMVHIPVQRKNKFLSLILVSSFRRLFKGTVQRDLFGWNWPHSITNTEMDTDMDTDTDIDTYMDKNKATQTRSRWTFAMDK